MLEITKNDKIIKHFHFFCGVGAAALGFNAATARVCGRTARFHCIGGIDSDQTAIKNFNRLTGAVGTVMDLFDYDQYLDFHGAAPPATWHVATPADIRAAAGGEQPHIVFLSPPCQGFSGFLSEELSLSDKYQALNGLVLRGMHLTLAAWKKELPEFILLENVPRMRQRGAAILTELNLLLKKHEYQISTETHNFGHFGPLAQSRKRILILAKHRKKVPGGVYQPRKTEIKSVGKALHAVPLPGDPAAGPLHELPRMNWQTSLRLALISAGGDETTLEKVDIQRDYFLTACHWAPPNSRGPRDQRLYGPIPFCQQYRLRRSNKNDNSHPFTAAAVLPKQNKTASYYNSKSRRQGRYGVTKWNSHCPTICASGKYNNSSFAVADPRVPKPHKHTLPIIISLDGTWHRPFTLFEMAVLQGLAAPDSDFFLAGTAADQRRQIGNAVPPPSATAIGGALASALLRGAHDHFYLTNDIYWV